MVSGVHFGDTHRQFARVCLCPIEQLSEGLEGRIGPNKHTEIKGPELSNKGIIKRLVVDLFNERRKGDGSIRHRPEQVGVIL